VSNTGALFPVSSDKANALRARLAELHIQEEDLQETFVRSGGKGGQNVNKVSTCVVLVHRPTGTSVQVPAGTLAGTQPLPGAQATGRSHRGRAARSAKPATAGERAHSTAENGAARAGPRTACWPTSTPRVPRRPCGPGSAATSSCYCSQNRPDCRALWRSGGMDLGSTPLQAFENRHQSLHSPAEHAMRTAA